MYISKFIVAAAALSLAAPAGAQTVSHTDGNMAGWTSSVVINPNGCSGGSSFQSAGAGNPGNYLHINQYSCGWVWTAHMSTFSWNPSTQGAITEFGTGYDKKSFGGSIGFGTMVRQGGLYYATPDVSDYGIESSGFWNNFDNPDEPLTGWCQVYATFPSNSFTCGAGVLDFSETGGQIDFGFYTANSGGPYSTQGGADNFHVELSHDEAPVSTPEPATIVLLASGLLALAGGARLRKTRA